jgi:hypothetical protein
MLQAVMAQHAAAVAAAQQQQQPNAEAEALPAVGAAKVAAALTVAEALQQLPSGWKSRGGTPTPQTAPAAAAAAANNPPAAEAAPAAAKAQAAPSATGIDHPSQPSAPVTAPAAAPTAEQVPSPSPAGAVCDELGGTDSFMAALLEGMDPSLLESDEGEGEGGAAGQPPAAAAAPTADVGAFVAAAQQARAEGSPQASQGRAGGAAAAPGANGSEAASPLVLRVASLSQWMPVGTSASPTKAPAGTSPSHATIQEDEHEEGNKDAGSEMADD